MVLGVAAFELTLAPKARGDLELVRSDRPGQRVLFVGNSATYYNDMPSMVRRLAAADHGGPTLFVVQYTAPVWKLRDASDDDGLRSLLREVRWDDVILQEHSDESPPFVEELHGRITAGGARTTLFVRGPSDDPTYTELAGRLPASLAPVGDAFDEAFRRNPYLALRADEEGHPNRAGSFLIACVFYATLTRRDPRPSGYGAGLPAYRSRFLKDVAWDVHSARATAPTR